MIIHFYRHAPSKFNVLGEDIIDCPLHISEKTKMLCKQMEGVYDIIICSTLKRAKDTLALSNLVHKDFVIYTNKCRESRCGNLTDLLEGETVEKDTETKEEFKKRVDKFLNSLKHLSKSYNKIAVVSHGHFIEQITGECPHNCGMIEYKI